MGEGTYCVCMRERESEKKRIWKNFYLNPYLFLVC